MWIVRTIAILLSLAGMSQLMSSLQSSFDSPMANVTYKEMETAVLPCSINFLGRHQVIWTDQRLILLTLNDRRIINDLRLSVERPFTRDWNLHIRNVSYKDQGVYKCQINTYPITIKTVNLEVQVPSKILDSTSTEVLVVQESTTVTLVCNISGIPMPTVTWYRLIANEKGEDTQSELCAGTNRTGISGEVLLIHNMSRYCGGLYECVAFNGFPPAVNKLFRVSVEFPPEINLPNKRIGQVLGKETILECIINAKPQAVGVWKKNGEQIKTVSGKYRIEPYTEDDHTIILSLRIIFIEKIDYGIYTCEASNILGRDIDEMAFFEYSVYRRPLSEITTTTTTSIIVETTSIRAENRSIKAETTSIKAEATSRAETTPFKAETTFIDLPFPSQHQQLHESSRRTTDKDFVHEEHQNFDARESNNMPVVNDKVNPKDAASSDASFTSTLSSSIMFTVTVIVISEWLLAVNRLLTRDPRSSEEAIECLQDENGLD